MTEAVGETKGMINDTIETVRRISKDLLPSSLEKFGLSQALEELCEKVSNPITKVVYEQKGEALEIPISKQLLLYRMVQELVNNALKHAEAPQIDVKFNWHTGLDLIVKDNGKGFDLEATRKDIKKGVGLYNIENRASLLDGDVTFESSPGKGAMVKIVIKNFD
ncbi:MAG: ATP-binding protein [Bacteroidota bacterium]